MNLKVPILKTDRLELIPLEQAHLNDLFEIYSDEEAMKYWDGYAHESIDVTREILDLHLDRIEEGTGLSWCIRLKEDPLLIGAISFNSLKEGGNGSIGYMLKRDHWRRGIMSEVLKKCIEYGFKKLKLHRIEAQVEPANVASQELLLRLGFHREGLLRERSFYKGAYQDHYIFSKLETD